MSNFSPVIRLHDVKVAYAKGIQILSRNKKWALNGVNLDIAHGETLGILGRNGAGKSTLLQLLGQMILPDSGTITFDVKRISLLALQVGFLGHLSGRENVILSSMFMGMSRSEISDKIADLIDFSGIGDAIDDPVNSYSAGMKTRLGFSVAFYVDADVILVDEVIAVGDAEFKQSARLAMKKKISEGKTAVIVSHDFSLLQNWCDRIVWLDKGMIIQEGTPDIVIKRYKESLHIK